VGVRGPPRNRSRRIDSDGDAVSTEKISESCRVAIGCCSAPGGPVKAPVRTRAIAGTGTSCASTGSSTDTRAISREAAHGPRWRGHGSRGLVILEPSISLYILVPRYAFPYVSPFPKRPRRRQTHGRTSRLSASPGQPTASDSCRAPLWGPGGLVSLGPLTFLRVERSSFGAYRVVAAPHRLGERRAGGGPRPPPRPGAGGGRRAGQPGPGPAPPLSLITLGGWWGRRNRRRSTHTHPPVSGPVTRYCMHSPARRERDL
jgi:hypothetical protein